MSKRRRARAGTAQPKGEQRPQAKRRPIRLSLESLGAQLHSACAVLQRNRYHFIALIVIVIIAGFIRLKGIGWSLPYILHPDEPCYLLVAKYMGEPGGLNSLPKDNIIYKIGESYPPLYIRFLLLQRKLLEGFGKDAIPPFSFYLFARWLNAAVGTVSIAVVFFVGTILFGPLTGLLGAAFLAVNPTYVEHARYATADIPMTLLALVAIYFSFVALNTGRNRDSYLALVCSLLAFMTKYNALPVVVLPTYAILRNSAKQGKEQVIRNTCVLTGLATGMAWLLVSHYHILNMLSVPYNPTGSIVEKQNVLALISAGAYWQAIVVALEGHVTLLLMLAGGILATYHGFKRPFVLEKLALVSAFMVTLFIAVSLFQFHGIKDLLPSIALMSLFWGASFEEIVLLVGTRISARWLRVVHWIMLGLAVLLLIPPFVNSIQYANYILQKDTRIITADWFLKNAPDGSIIAIEYDAVEFLPEYGGFPGPKTFRSVVVESLATIPIEAYREAGVRYLVADSRATDQGGYFANPDNRQFLDNVNRVLEISNEGRPGPYRIILELKGEQ